MFGLFIGFCLKNNQRASGSCWGWKSQDCRREGATWSCPIGAVSRRIRAIGWRLRAAYGTGSYYSAGGAAVVVSYQPSCGLGSCGLTTQRSPTRGPPHVIIVGHIVVLELINLNVVSWYNRGYLKAWRCAVEGGETSSLRRQECGRLGLQTYVVFRHNRSVGPWSPKNPLCSKLAARQSSNVVETQNNPPKYLVHWLRPTHGRHIQLIHWRRSRQQTKGSFRFPHLRQRLCIELHHQIQGVVSTPRTSLIEWRTGHTQIQKRPKNSVTSVYKYVNGAYQIRRLRFRRRV